MPITTLDDLNRNPFIQGELFEVILGPKGLVEVPRFISGVMVVGSEHPVAVGVRSASQSKTVLTFTPLWEQIARHDAKVTEDTFDFDVTLNGTTDCEYKIEGYWFCNTTSSTSLSLRVNGSTAGLSNDGGSYDETGSSGTSSSMLVARKLQASANQELYFTHEMYMKTGANRLGRSLISSTYGTAAASSEVTVTNWKAEDTTTEVTQLGMDGVAGNCIGAGSWFKLYRRPEFDNTKIKIWVF